MGDIQVLEVDMRDTEELGRVEQRVMLSNTAKEIVLWNIFSYTKSTDQAEVYNRDKCYEILR